METASAAVSVGSAALALAGHSCSGAAGWTAAAGGCVAVAAVWQSDHLCLEEA